MRRAFSLIELLVVVAIIALLVAMTMGVAGVMQRQGMKTKTRTILSIIQTSVLTHSAERGGVLNGVEHPLAGSKAPRLRFTRSDGTTLVASAGEALRGPSATAALVPGVELRDDDLFDDDQAPQFQGVSRQHLTILGGAYPPVTRYHLVPWRWADPATANTLAGCRLVAGTDKVSDTGPFLQSVLARNGGFNELLKLGALVTAPDDSSLACDDRIWSGQPPGLPKRSFRFADQGYLVRGQALYDAWGNEILYTQIDTKVQRLASAGPDGRFGGAAAADNVVLGSD